MTFPDVCEQWVKDPHSHEILRMSEDFGVMNLFLSGCLPATNGR